MSKVREIEFVCQAGCGGYVFQCKTLGFGARQPIPRSTRTEKASPSRTHRSFPAGSADDGDYRWTLPGWRWSQQWYGGVPHGTNQKAIDVIRDRRPDVVPMVLRCIFTTSGRIATVAAHARRVCRYQQNGSRAANAASDDQCHVDEAPDDNRWMLGGYSCSFRSSLSVIEPQASPV